MVEKAVAKNTKITVQKVFVLKKSVIACIVAFFAVLILIVFGAYALSHDSEEKEINVFYSSLINGAIAVTDINKPTCIIDGKGVAGIKYSLKKEFAAVVMSDGATYSLYYTDGKTAKHLTASASNNYVIAADGTAVVYSDSASELYFYDALTDNSIYIDGSVMSFSVSPSGDAVVYVKTEESENALYLYADGKTSRIGENYVPLGVSDDLQMIYVLSNDNSLYMLDENGEMTAKICSEVKADMFFLSADMSSIVFSDGTYTYISTEGKSRNRLVEAIAMPANGKALYSDSQGKTTVSYNLFDTFYYSAEGENVGSLYYIDKNFARTDVARNVLTYIITEENSVVYLTSDYEIFKYDSGKTTLLHSDAYHMMATSDGKYVYFINSASELFCIKNRKITLVAQNVRKIYMTKSDKLLFINRDEELFSVTGRKAGDKIDDNVYACVCSGSSVFYMKNYSSQSGVFELYGSDGSLKFKLIDQNISAVI